eukprot:tig00001130_g7240.t1
MERSSKSGVPFSVGRQRAYTGHLNSLASAVGDVSFTTLAKLTPAPKSPPHVQPRPGTSGSAGERPSSSSGGAGAAEQRRQDKGYALLASELDALKNEIASMEQSILAFKGSAVGAGAVDASQAPFLAPAGLVGKGKGLPAGLTRIPSLYHVKATSPLPQLFTSGKAVWNDAARTWESPVFPSANPSTREEAALLAQAVDAMLAGVTKPAFSALKAKADGDLNASELMRDIQSLHQESVVLNLAFSEVVRQVRVQCLERGALLERIRARFVGMLEVLVALLYRLLRTHQHEVWVRSQLTQARNVALKEEDSARTEMTRLKQERDDLSGRMLALEKQLTQTIMEKDEYRARSEREKGILEYEVTQLQRRIDRYVIEKEEAVASAVERMQQSVREALAAKARPPPAPAPDPAPALAPRGRG